jgi:hypothetical protein
MAVVRRRRRSQRQLAGLARPGPAQLVQAAPPARRRAAVQKNIRATILVDAKVSCPSQALPGKGHAFRCQLSSKYGSGTLTLTQQDAQGKCFLYTGKAGAFSWTPANHNVVCLP